MRAYISAVLIIVFVLMFSLSAIVAADAPGWLDGVKSWLTDEVVFSIVAGVTGLVLGYFVKHVMYRRAKAVIDAIDTALDDDLLSKAEIKNIVSAWKTGQIQNQPPGASC